MKKNYKKILSIICFGMIGISAFAQGTWKAAGTEALVAPGVELSYVGIYGLSVMHSDPSTAGVIGKTDAGAPTVSYNSVDWDNAAIIQGSTNGMYFAFKPSSNGVLDLSVKMGSGKYTFVAELTSAFASDLTTLTTVTAPSSVAVAGGGIPSVIASSTNYSLPQVYDSYSNTTLTWNATTVFQSSGANQYAVMSFPVSANKIYVAGVTGSKLMLRGINYTISTSIASVNADKKILSIQNLGNGSLIFRMNESVRICIYNTLGVLISQKLVSPTTNNVDISRLTPGVYFVKDVNNEYNTQKFIVE